MTRATFLRCAAAGIAATAIAQPARAQPAGEYLVHGEPTGVAFVRVEPANAAAGDWPMAFFYYADGVLNGSATMRGAADCAADRVTGTLLGAIGQDGLALPLPPGDQLPAFLFEREDSSGDGAIVAFICGRAEERSALSERPVAGPVDEAARRYIALRGAGLGHEAARGLAIRDFAEAVALAETTVPEAQRDAVTAILAQVRAGPERNGTE